MDIQIAFIIYLILYRMAIIAVGALSITQGYRLFSRVVGSQSKDATESSSKSDSPTEAKIKLSGMEFNFKSASPGLFFTFFGVVVILVMIVTGGPELTMKTLEKGNAMTMRGETDPFTAELKAARQHVSSKEFDEAARQYRKALKIASEAMNELAWVYLQKDDANLEDALALSEMAVKYSQIDTQSANHLDTLADILYKKGEFKKALDAIEKAAALDSKYKDKVAKFRQAAK
ncbi:hypothetical protein QUF90_12360 [Desulfococcaceae bacterium HSG9]|nr:hypothetical protein [Desulfococcaceae bacterium HSG9]